MRPDADLDVAYDELTGPDLDPSRWSPARLPLPDGATHTPIDPNARVVVAGGEVQVTIPRFSVAHDTYQAVDSAKHLVFSSQQFGVPPDGAATFGVDLAVENLGGDPGDYRRGMAAFHVLDLAGRRPVFSVCGTSSRVLAMHEHLGGSDVDPPFFHVVESPYDDYGDDFTRLRACEIVLDRTRSRASWHVDGHRIYQTGDTLIPERVRIGFGIWTMVPIRDGRSRSLVGQGLGGRWHRFRTRGVGPPTSGGSPGTHLDPAPTVPVSR